MKQLLTLILLTLLFSCHDEQTTEVTIDVAIHIKNDNHTTPLLVVFENKSKNASSFKWTFEGGEPATSDIKNPDPVLFAEPGEHTIKEMSKVATDVGTNNIDLVRINAITN